eukprot:322905-Hanusia_phi.AAC.1
MRTAAEHRGSKSSSSARISLPDCQPRTPLRVLLPFSSSMSAVDEELLLLQQSHQLPVLGHSPRDSPPPLLLEEWLQRLLRPRQISRGVEDKEAARPAHGDGSEPARRLRCRALLA